MEDLFLFTLRRQEPSNGTVACDDKIQKKKLTRYRYLPERINDKLFSQLT